MSGRRQDYARLARYVADRVAELGLRQKDVEAAGGPSPATFRRIIGGNPWSADGRFDQSTLNGLDVALEWKVGSSWDIAYGGEPVLAGKTTTPARPSARRPPQRRQTKPTATGRAQVQDPPIADDLIERGRARIRDAPGLADAQRQRLLDLYEETVVQDWQLINRRVESIREVSADDTGGLSADAG